jgi:predicted NAD-dependent protein-ADP-ribosyltransferase YbiA (DUF1768 family)
MSEAGLNVLGFALMQVRAELDEKAVPRTSSS